MNRVLFVEDFKITGKLYQQKLQTGGFTVEVANTGQAALKAVAKFKPDIVILDLVLPDMDGTELLKRIRSQPETQTLPVIVFTNSFVEEALEAARKAGANDCLRKSQTTPTYLIQVINEIIAASARKPRGASSQAGAASASGADRALGGGDSGASSADDAGEEFADDPDGAAESPIDFFRRLPVKLRLCEEVAERKPIVSQLLDETRALAESETASKTPELATVAEALGALLRELHEKPHYIGDSTLRTISQTVDFIVAIYRDPKAFAPRPNAPNDILVVDDDPICLKSVALALEKARLKSVCVDDPEAACTLLAQNRYVLVISDILMPQMDGFELCSRLRTFRINKTTPVIFLTQADTFQSRVRSAAMGGTDFIGKPFLHLELSLKALIHVVRSRSEAEVTPFKDFVPFG